MDTSSHLIMGLTLGGLAIAAAGSGSVTDPHAAQALIAVAVLGSNAPDFDTVLRLKGYDTYLRTHRGVSHSLPMLLIWPALLAPLAGLLFHSPAHLGLLYLWGLAAVLLHVGLDLFNAYGVQCFRPISRRWFHLDTIPIFDPVLFILHAASLALWRFGSVPPMILFASLYGLTGIYIGCRMAIRFILLRRVRRCYEDRGLVFLVPEWSCWHWKYVCEADNTFISGSVTPVSLREEVRFDKQQQNDIILAAMGTDGVRTFLGFAHRVHITWRKLQSGYQVELRDVRFRHRSKLAFGVDVRLDERLNVLGESLGWQKKIWEPPFA